METNGFFLHISGIDGKYEDINITRQQPIMATVFIIKVLSSNLGDSDGSAMPFINRSKVKNITGLAVQNLAQNVE